ncbi:Tryptophan--tRNA ligase 2 [Edwardsiella tarda]|nr:Tryptophan--tRNA ligase 2 [Edwardsiella tarda]
MVFTYLDAFHPDAERVAQMKEQYRRGGLGDSQCKRELEGCLQELLAPIRQRRAEFLADPAMLLQILRQGNERARAVSQQTLMAVKRGLGLPLMY